VLVGVSVCVCVGVSVGISVCVCVGVFVLVGGLEYTPYNCGWWKGVCIFAAFQ
jgi:hypothetical protein